MGRHPASLCLWSLKDRLWHAALSYGLTLRSGYQPPYVCCSDKASDVRLLSAVVMAMQSGRNPMLT